MTEEFTQGTIISDIRSNKYCNIRCKGVVISARCDLAQNKINTFHYLSALSLEDWIYEELYFKIIDEKKRSVEGEIKRVAKDNELDYTVLCEGGYDRMERVFRKCLSAKRWDEILNKIQEMKKLDQYFLYDERKYKKEFLKQSNNYKLFKSKIRDVMLGNYPKFVFIPQSCYSTNQILNNGLVIDLQDIYQLNTEIAKRIAQNEIDGAKIKSEEKRKEYNNYFFLNSDMDFVIIEGQIKSPWVEYVLQHFAHEFIRIGVENATQNEIEKICDDLL